MTTSSQVLILCRFDITLRKESQASLVPANGSRFIASLFAGILLLVLSSPCTSTAAYGKEPSGSIRSHHTSGARAMVTISLADFGAVGDGVTNDGPALNSALESLADAGGGELFVPDGHYVIVSPVLVDFSGRATSIIIRGTPSSGPGGPPDHPGQGLGLTAEFVIKTGEAHDAITLRNLNTLAVENLVFIGDPAATNDAKIVLSLSGINNATINTCEFYGLSSLVAGGAIVREVGGELIIAGSAFLGCAANSGLYTSIVQVYDWTALSITGTRFVDYGDRSDFFSKTTMMSPFSWVSVGGAAPLTNLSPRRDITFRDVLLDEGAYNALSVRPDLFPVANGGAISLVYLSQLYVNVTNLGEVGVRIHHAENVLIENSHFGWSHNSIGAMELAYVNDAILNQIECVLSADTIIIDNNVAEVSVINSVYQTLASQAPVTRVITTADPADGPPGYVNQEYLDILGHRPDVPGYVYWSQQQARCGGAQCASNEALLDYLKGHPAPTFSINGQLLDTDRLPVASATVALSGTHQVKTLTDAQGRYTFSGLATSGQYTVTPSKAFYTFNGTNGSPGTSSRSFVTPPGDQTADFTGNLARYSIQGRVSNSTNGQAIAGVTIRLTGGPAGFNPQAQTTNTAGAYSFAGVPAGFTYSLTATKNFYNLAPPVRTLLLTGPTAGFDFTGALRTYSIVGTVKDGTNPLSNVTITLSGDANRVASTDANGAYRFDGVVAGGNYTFTPTKQGYAFAPASAVFRALDQNVHPDFSASRLPILLLTEGDTNRAIAFNSISMLREPLDLFTTPLDFSPDRRTRIMLFARNFPQSPTITARAEDAMGNVFPLAIEFTQSLPEAPGITQINVRLSSQIPTGVDVKLTITVDGVTSNIVLVGISRP